MRRGVDTAILQGSVPFSEYAYDPARCEIPPGDLSRLSRLATTFRLGELRESVEPEGKPEHRVPGELDRAIVDFRDALNQNLPIVFTIPVSAEFKTAGRSVQRWSKDFPAIGEMHAMVVTAHVGGRSCQSRSDGSGAGAGAFLVRSSWGTGWGTDGSMWIDDCLMMQAMDEAFVLHGPEDDLSLGPSDARILDLTVEPRRDGKFVDFMIDARIESEPRGGFQIHLVITGTDQRKSIPLEDHDPVRRPFDGRPYFRARDPSENPIVIPTGPVKHRIFVKRRELDELLEPGEKYLTATIQLLRNKRTLDAGAVLSQSPTFSIAQDVFR